MGENCSAGSRLIVHRSRKAELLEAIGEAIGLCRKAGAGARVIGHRDLSPTACPGGALYAFVQAGHWTGVGPYPPVVVQPPKGTPAPVVPPKPKRVQLDVDGDFGPATKRRLQQWAGVATDGVLGPISWKAIQRKLGVGVDGIPGPITWKAIQRRVGAKADGLPGSVTYAGLQTYLNGQP